MSSLDDFRGTEEPEERGIPVDIDAILDAREAEARPKNPRFLSMTAAERAFVSVIIFMIVLVIGALLLIATNRITLPI